MKIIFTIFTLFLLAGCSKNDMKPLDFKDQKPRLVIEEYLSGNVKASEFYKIDLAKLQDNLRLILMENGMGSS